MPINLLAGSIERVGNWVEIYDKFLNNTKGFVLNEAFCIICQLSVNQILAKKILLFYFVLKHLYLNFFRKFRNISY